jgi:hypothetical protein
MCHRGFARPHRDFLDFGLFFAKGKDEGIKFIDIPPQPPIAPTSYKSLLSFFNLVESSQLFVVVTSHAACDLQHQI